MGVCVGFFSVKIWASVLSPFASMLLVVSHSVSNNFLYSCVPLLLLMLWSDAIFLSLSVMKILFCVSSIICCRLIFVIVPSVLNVVYNLRSLSFCEPRVLIMSLCVCE